MSRVKKSELVRLSDAPAIVEELTGEKPHPCTVHRWAKNGLSGIKLRTIFACGCRRTKLEWLNLFFEEVADAKSNSDSPCPQSGHKMRTRGSMEDDRKYLENEGI